MTAPKRKRRGPVTSVEVDSAVSDIPTCRPLATSNDPQLGLDFHSVAHRTFGNAHRTPAPPPLPALWIRLSPAEPTEAYDTYWRFAFERQAIFFRRLAGEPPPWTSDPILDRYKFTNAYRASDRVSQFLIRNVIYAGSYDLKDVFFRTLLFKLFNKIETWRLIETAIGDVSFSTYQFEAYDAILTRAMARGDRIYSAAYIMPSGPSSGEAEPRKHRFHLRLIERMMHDNVPARLAEMRSMHDAFALLRTYPSIGDFLAYQFATDINYSKVTDFSESEFVQPGPGALDGIRKCFASLGGLTETEVIRFMADRQEEEFDRLGLSFQTLWGRRLQLIDCQNLFCELGKYARIRHPDIRGVSDRKRIKQHFSPAKDSLGVWYPPKWDINDRVSAGCLANNAPAIPEGRDQ